jgi:tRNA(Ile)-lysidine synthase TilS/MesJ
MIANMTSVTPNLATIAVVTAHGRQLLTGRPSDRIIDVLNRHNVPWSAVSIYITSAPGAEPRLVPCLDERLDHLPGTAEILLYFNRNVNPFIFALDGFLRADSDDPEGAATEYFYQKLDNDSGATESYLKKLSPAECQDIIADRVSDTIRAHVPPGSEIVVGVSGGGDSNALLYGLSRLANDGITVHPVILMGIPDWDAGVPRAQALCAKYELPLTIVTEDEVKDLLGVPHDSMPLIDRFESEFPGDDFEFLGTLLIRLALSKQARDRGTSYICTGVNLEDIVCENLYRVSSGLSPAGFPIRQIGDMNLLLPLWLCPKRIIDGCFPKFSLENYDARYPCFSLGRNLYYSVVYAMQSQFPGYLEQLATGLSKISLANPVEYVYHERLGFHVERSVSFPLMQRFQKMLGRSLVGS